MRTPAPLALLFAIALAPAFAADLFVSPTGNDTWSGTRADAVSGGADGPFRSLERARDDVDMLPTLMTQLTPRAPLFAPEAERAMLLQLVDGLLSRRPTGSSP